MSRYHNYELGSAYQIGIVLASASVITGMIAGLWRGSARGGGASLHQARSVCTRRAARCAPLVLACSSRSGGHGFDRHEPKRLKTSMGASRAMALKKAGFSVSLISPMNSTSRELRRGRMHTSKYSRSTLSTFAAILRGNPHRWAIRMARSGAFSGEIRPMNARYVGLIGCGVQSPAGIP